MSDKKTKKKRDPRFQPSGRLVGANDIQAANNGPGPAPAEKLAGGGPGVVNSRENA